MSGANKIHAAQYNQRSFFYSKNDLFYDGTILAANFLFDRYKFSFPMMDWIIEDKLSDYKNDILLKYLLGKSLFLQNKYDLATITVKEILTINNDFAPALDLLFSINLHTDNEQEAIEICSKILDIFPGHPRWQAYNQYLIEH